MNYLQEDILIQIGIGVVLLAVAYKFYRDKKKKKKKKNDDSNQSPSNPVIGIRIKLRGKVNSNNFVAGMNVIKKGNRNLYDKIVAKTVTVNIIEGHKIIDGKPDKTWLAQAPINGDRMTFFAGTMAIYERKYDTAHLWARVITHEYGHLLRYRHDTPSSTKTMNAWVTQQVNSYGGKVNTITL